MNCEVRAEMGNVTSWEEQAAGSVFDQNTYRYLNRDIDIMSDCAEKEAQ